MDEWKVGERNRGRINKRQNLKKMSGAIKKTTGLAGLAVNPAAHHSLGILYGKILRTLQKMPEDAAYRKYTEQIINERAGFLKRSTSYLQIEAQINCGQVEELITQAENELMLARKMLTWKPWEPLCKEASPDQWSWPPTNPTKPNK